VYVLDLFTEDLNIFQTVASEAQGMGKIQMIPTMQEKG